ncbi:MAG: hypothetical protein ACI4RF_01030, partial [Eubacterium sp.]
ELFVKSVEKYLIYLESVLNDMNRGMVIYTNEDREIIRLIKDDYQSFIKNSDKFTKLYLFMIKHNIMVDWIRKNEFDPIQRFIRKLK